MISNKTISAANRTLSEDTNGLTTIASNHSVKISSKRNRKDKKTINSS